MSKKKQEKSPFEYQSPAERRAAERKMVLSMICRSGNGRCLIWTGPIYDASVPCFRTGQNGRTGARRWLWIDSGRECPDGHQVKNGCGNPLCVAPGCSYLTGKGSKSGKKSA